MAERDKNGKFKPRAKSEETVVDDAAVNASSVEQVPEDIAGEDAAADTKPPERRGRGRPANPKNDKSKAKANDGPRKRHTRTKADTDTLANQILGTHILVAGLTGLPELIITPQQSVILAERLHNMAEEFGVSAVLGGKIGATISLISALGIIYVPRVAAIQRRAQAYQAAQASGDVPAGANRPATYEGEAETVAGDNVQS
jgi:hypothetical protein